MQYLMFSAFLVFYTTLGFNGASAASAKSLRAAKPVDIIKLGNQTTTARFLIMGGLHGNESTTPEFVDWVAKRFKNGRSHLNRLPEWVGIDFIPRSNPDGLHMKTRNNSRGVDLNRNFSTLWGQSSSPPGKHAFSEPETQKIKSIFKARNYIGSVDVHGYVNWFVSPSHPKLVGKNDPKQITKWKRWIGTLQSEIDRLPTKYYLKSAGALGDGGAFEDWAYWEADSYAFCLELASKTLQKTGLTHLSFETYELALARIFRETLRLKGFKTIEEALADTN